MSSRLTVTVFLIVFALLGEIQRGKERGRRTKGEGKRVKVGVGGCEKRHKKRREGKFEQTENCKAYQDWPFTEIGFASH